MNGSLRFIKDKSSIIFIMFNDDGLIVDINEFTIKVLGREILNQNINCVIVDFFNDFDIKKLYEKPQPILLNVQTLSGLPETFYFHIFREEEMNYAYGELNNEEVLLLRNEIVRMNAELSNVNRELYKKKAELEHLNDLKNHFLSMAAHDLRNPIGNIMNFGELLANQLSKQFSQKQKEYMEIIISLSKFSLSLLNNLLEIARIETGKLNLKLKSTDINSLITQVVEFNHFLAEKKDIKIELKLPMQLAKVRIDENAIQQVMNNILSNALKFSFPDSIITLGVIPGDDYHTVFVKDRGKGIPEDEYDKLFKPFSVTSNLPTGEEKNTGLGLVIVKKIVTSHSGKVWFESKTGVGTTFYFTIPVEK